MELLLYPYLRPTAPHLKEYGEGPLIPNLYPQMCELQTVFADGSVDTPTTVAKEVCTELTSSYL